MERIEFGKRVRARWKKDQEPAKETESHFTAEGRVVGVDGELLRLKTASGAEVVVHRRTIL